jgi:hypothetical protein
MSNNREKGREVLELALQELDAVAEHFYSQHKAGTAAAVLSLCREIYSKAHGTEVAAMMFYRMADELAVKNHKKYF